MLSDREGPGAIEAQMKVTKARLEDSRAEERKGMEEEKAPTRSTDYVSVTCSI